MTASRQYPGLLLSPRHEALLLASAVAPEVATARGYRSLDTKAAVGRLGFSERQRVAPGLLIPIFSPVTGEVVLHQYRPDEPRCDASGKPVKYETPRRASLAIDAHPMIRTQLGDPSIPLLWTEGIRKADSAVSRGLCCAALLGVHGFRGTNKLGGKVALPELQAIAHNGRQEYLVFDSDIMLKPAVYEALRQFKALLEHCGARVAVIYLPSGTDGAKVGLDDYLAAGHTQDDLLRLASPDVLPPTAKVSLNGDGGSAQVSAPADLDALTRTAAPMLEAPDPLALIEQAIRAQGYGGEIGPAKLVHIGLATRVLKPRAGTMPGHMLLLGPPGSGKNHALNVNLRLHPDAAYHTIDAGSPRALIYDTADLRHRVLVFGEADSMPSGEDNSAASAIRNLLQDGHLHYDVPVRDPETNLYVTHKIDKPGPTMLVTTATRRLSEQLDTRLFTVEVPDDQKQLCAALTTQATLELDGVPEPDPAVIAYQALLQAKAPWAVVVPFVKAITDALGRGVVAARVLRDFHRLTALIKAVTVLRYPLRRQDDQGRLVADIDDYETVYGLVKDVYTSTATGAGASVRRVVEAVTALCGEGKSPVSALDVAVRLKVHKSTASRHVRIALHGGWLVNKEERAGRYDLAIGDPLPQDGLPTPDDIRRVYFPPRNACNHATKAPKPNNSTPGVVAETVAAVYGPATTATVHGCTVADANNPATNPATAETQTGRGLEGNGCTVAAETEGDIPMRVPPSRNGDSLRDAVPAAPHDSVGRPGAYAFAVAQGRGFPGVRLGPGRHVLAGARAWELFTSHPKTSVRDLDAAIAGLRTLDAAEVLP